jgi:lysophospholipase L1-like esterase
MPTLASAAEPFSLRDGDRVVLIGSTLIEREQRYGYWETALTRFYPDRNVTYRNLGWSGDTVFGEAQARFGGPADGFRHLVDHVVALKPTVLVVGYGTNESFAGPKGLPHFLKGLNTLLDTLKPTQARMVLLSPPRQEDLGRPLPDPKEQNRNLRLYADAIRETAGKRGLPFVDLYDLLGPDRDAGGKPAPLTDNGVHLTAWGYWRSAPQLEHGLGLTESPWRITIEAKGEPVAQGARVTRLGAEPLSFQVTDEKLPLPPPPAEGAPSTPPKGEQRRLRVAGLAPGSYALTIDGKEVARATAEQWAAGVVLDRGPEFEQAEQLRQAIIAKNQLYFHRWRPQNETYLFGFRKHEQGQNAREIPQFDPLVEKREADIAKLRVPAAHTYQIVRQRAER